MDNVRSQLNGMKRKVDNVRGVLKKELLYCFPRLRARQILFDHIPKCGGTSLNLYLVAHYPERKIFTVNGIKPTESIEEFKALAPCKKTRYDLVKGHLAIELLDHVSAEMLKITVLRDPIDRIISHFYYAKRTKQHYLYSKIKKSGMDLEQYVTSGLSDELQNYYTTFFSGLTARDVERNPEKAIIRAVQIVQERYDIVGFLDDFKSFANELKKQAKFRHDYQDVRLNITANRPSLDDILPSTLKIIEELNHIDVSFYKKIKEVRAN